jgi:hypothetical protein
MEMGWMKAGYLLLNCTYGQLQLVVRFHLILELSAPGVVLGLLITKFALCFCYILGSFPWLFAQGIVPVESMNMATKMIEDEGLSILPRKLFVVHMGY